MGGRDLVLDCELVVFDKLGRPDFDAFSARARLRRPSSVREAAATAPALLVAFDLLVLEGEDLRRQSWAHRRARLDDLGPAAAASPYPAFDAVEPPFCLDVPSRPSGEQVGHRRAP